MQHPIHIPPSAPARLVVLASGTGSLLESLLSAAVDDYPARVVAVGVDQSTFGPAVFLWFFVIGALTVLLTGGVRRRPKRVKPVAPVEEPLFDEDVEDDDEALTTPIPDVAAESDVEPVPEPEPEPEDEPEPAPPPKPVRPAPDLEDVEDLMVVDDDIEPERDR